MEFVVLWSGRQVDSDFLLDGLAVLGRGSHKGLHYLRKGVVRSMKLA